MLYKVFFSSLILINLKYEIIFIFSKKEEEEEAENNKWKKTAGDDKEYRECVEITV